MRIVFWNALTGFKDLGFTTVAAGFLTAIVQTSVDYPVEQIKIQKMINNNHNILSAFRQPNLMKGFTLTLSRNIGFAVILNTFIDGQEQSHYHGALGGFFGSVITHPIDCLKTWYQAGNTNYPTHWKVSSYFNGWHLRAGISLVSMNIGWVVYSRVNQYLHAQDDEALNSS